MTTSDTIKDLCGSVNPMPCDLTLEEKKRAHKLGILEYHHKTTDAPWYVARGWRAFEFSESQWRFRITPGKEHLLCQKESGKTMEEYEYMTADTAENCAEIFKWKQAGRVEIYDDPRWLLSAHFGLHFGQKYRRKKPAQDVLLTDPEEISQGSYIGAIDVRVHDDATWKRSFVLTTQQAQNELNIRHSFRVTPGKTLPPKKTKKLVDRTPEEFWPFIGTWWYRYTDKKTRNRYLINDSDFPFQENKEIAILGTEDWQPMQKEIEVEG
jgi:hypothetical protein